MMDTFSLFLSYLPQLLHGLLITIELMFATIAAGLILALSLTLLYFCGGIIAKKLIDFYIFIIRGTPSLIQIYLIYYGCAQFEMIRHSFLWVVLAKPFPCAIIALALNTAAYTTELLRGAVRAIPAGESEAADAFGFNRTQALCYLLMPRAIRMVLPAYSNEVVMILKGTSLASTITLLELMGTTRQIISATYDSIPFLLLAGVIYLILNAILIGIFRLIEKKYNRYL